MKSPFVVLPHRPIIRSRDVPAIVARYRGRANFEIEHCRDCEAPHGAPWECPCQGVVVVRDALGAVIGEVRR